MTMIEFTCLKSTIKMGVIQPVRKRKRRTKERHGSGSAIYPVRRKEETHYEMRVQE